MEVKFMDVSYSFQRKLFLKDANIVCKKGEITTFLLDDTSVTSTIFSLILGDIKPKKGELLFNERERGKRRIKISYFSKNCADTIFVQTVREALSIPLSFTSFGDKDDVRKVKVLEDVFLDKNYLDRDISTLSRGEKVRIAFASFLLEDSTILLIDDPFYFFDFLSKKEFVRLFKGIKKKKTILFFTNDTTFAGEISDFIYVVSKNKILAGGDAQMILTDKKLLDKVRLSMPPILEFLDIVKKEKNIKMLYRSEMNDLIKDIYRNVR